MNRSRPGLVPYAATPFRAGLQVLADLFVIGWAALWVLIGRAVHTAIMAFATLGRQVQDGAGGIAGNLRDAGDRAGRVPLLGDALRAPLQKAGEAASGLSNAGAGLDERATRLALILALAVAVPPILALAVPWLLLRLRFARRAGAARALARSVQGERLLALRALATRPLPQLLRVADDPVERWRLDDPDVIRRLAALELRSSGVRPPKSRPAAAVTTGTALPTLELPSGPEGEVSSRRPVRG